MNLFQISQSEILAFLVIMVRVGAMMFIFPIFGNKFTPGLVKILFSFVISLVIFPIVRSIAIANVKEEIFTLILLVLSELFIGLLIGLMSRMVFYAVSYCSQIVSFQMGFGIVNVLDPSTQSRVSIINQFQITVVTLLFLITNSHYLFFEALVKSYFEVAPLQIKLSDDFLKEIITISSTVFKSGIKLASPIAVILLVSNAGFGVMARAVPQMNVFMVSFSVTIGVGFLILGVTLPLFVSLVGDEFTHLEDYIFRMLKTV